MAKTVKNTGSSEAKPTFTTGILFYGIEGVPSRPVLESLVHSSRQFELVFAGGPTDEYTEILLKEGRMKSQEGFQPGCDVYIPCDARCSWNILKSLQGIQAGMLQEVDYLRATAVESTAGKPGFSSLFSWLWYKKSNAFFGADTNNFAQYSALIIKGETLAKIWNLEIPLSVMTIQNRLVQMQFSAGGFKVQSAQLPDYAYLGRKQWSAGLKDQIRWFFPLALKQFREGKGFKEKAQSFSRFLFASLSIFCLLFMPWISQDYGMTWDEKLQYEYAQDIYKYLASFGEDTTIFDFKNKSGLWQPMQYYGSFSDLITVAVNKWLDIDPKNHYETRHVINAVFGAVGLIFAGLLAYTLSGSWLAGFLAFLLLLLTPSYFGHSMNNPKDVPFAVGFFMAMYYMVRFVRELPSPTFATRLLFILSAALSISIRVGGILLFPYLLAFAGLKWLHLFFVKGGSSPWKQLRPYVVHVITVVAGGYFLGLIFWPYALKAPLANPLNALKGLSNVNYTTSYETFEGVRTYMSQVPPYYAIKLILLGTPLILLLGVVLHLAGLVKALPEKRWWTLALLFMFGFPLFWAAYKESMLYNGWRHWFFVYINLVVFGAWGWSWVLENGPKAVRWVSLVLLLVGSGNILHWYVRSHPNEYIYFNELAGGLKGAYGNYETEYYSNSLREAVEWMVNNTDVHSRQIVVVTNNEPLTAQYYFNKYTDSVRVEWTREYELSRKMADYAIFTSRTMSKTTLQKGYWPPRGVIHTIAVDEVPLCVVVKRENNYAAQAYLFQEQNKLDSSTHYFNLAISYEPNNEELYRAQALNYLNMGAAYYDSADKAVRKSIELLPENFIAYDVLGMVYFTRRDFEKARESFQNSIKYKINYTNAHYNLGIAWFNLGNYSEAAKEFENSVKYGGHRADFYKLLGMSLVNLNQFDQAMQMLQNSLSINDKDPETYQYIGKIYELKGDQATAGRFYQQAAQMMGQ